MSEQTYLRFHIGPVQSWIAQARRTQDLFTGSRLLSLLAGAGMKKAVEEGATIVVPWVPDGEIQESASYPHQFTLRCDTDQATDIEEDITTAICDTWRSIAGDVKTYIKELGENQKRGNQERGVTFTEEIWKRQIENFLEVYAVQTSVSGDYSADNQRLTHLMKTRKQLRHIYTQAEPGHKCSITGEHEALHHKESGFASLDEVQEFWGTIRQLYPNKAEFNKGERLCTISTVKRFAHNCLEALHEPRFPSTSSIAIAPFRARILEQSGDETVVGALSAYLHVLRKLINSLGLDWKDLYFTKDKDIVPEHFPYLEALIADAHKWEAYPFVWYKLLSIDGDWFFEDTLIPQTLENYTGTQVTSDFLNPAREALRQLHKAVGMKPSPYYAIIFMDGDNMGELAATFDDEATHRDFSEGLIKFAQSSIRSAVEDNTPGRVIYSGGDDVMAFVPMAYALQTADKIAMQFSQEIGKTMSAGIAIVHHTHSLQSALKEARQAEKTAKRIDGKEKTKDAFCMKFLRRSGEAREATLHWAHKHRIMPVIMRLAKYMEQDILARQLATEMRDFVYSTVPFKAKSDDKAFAVEIGADPRKEEFKRIFERRINPSERNVYDDALKKLRGKIVEIAEHKNNGQDWHSVATLIQFARFISQTEVPDVAGD